jgi:hypothetical protein
MKRSDRNLPNASGNRCGDRLDTPALVLDDHWALENRQVDCARGTIR